MKSLLLLILALAGLSQAQIEYDGGRTTLVDTVRWGDSNDSASYLLMRGQSKFRDSLGTWRALSGIDSCSKPIVMSSGTIYPKYKPELSYEVRGSSGNTDSTQAKLRMDSRYCGSATDTNKCSPWVPAGRFRGDTSTFVMDSLITVATTSGTTWKPTKQLFDVPGGSQIRMCADGFKTGTSATDSTFFRRLVVRLSSVPSGGIPPSAVSISGVSLGTVDVSSSALPTGAATSANQTNGSALTQLVDSAGSKIGSTAHALNVNITGGSSSGAVAQGSTTSGQTGGLTQAAVTTAAPTYTTAQTSPLSLTTGGALRVDASAASLTVGTHAVTQSGTWTLQPGNTANTTAWLVTGTGGTFPASQSGTWNDRMQDGSGNALASSATTPGGTEQALITRNIPSGTQAVSGTVTANAGTGTMAVSAASLPLPASAATSTKQSDGTQKTMIVDGVGSIIASTSNNLNVQCANCSGSGVSAADEASFTAGASTFALGGGAYQVTQTTNPLTTGQQGAFQSTRFRALHVNLRDSTGAVLGNSTTPLQVSLANTGSNGTAVSVNCSNCSGSGVSATDEAAFTAGTSTFAPGGGLYQVTQTSNPLTTGQQGAFQTTRFRALHVTLRDSTGAVFGNSTTPIQVSLANTAANGTAVKVDGSAVTQPVSGTVTANAGTGTFATNVSQINGVTPLMGNGITGTGSQRVTIASDNTAFAVNAAQSGTWNITNVSGTVSLPTGASTAAKQPALGTAGSASADVISVQGIASMTPLLANPGTAANWGTGATGSAAPANAQYAGANSSGNLTGLIQADGSVKIDVSTATTTQLVALSSTKKIYVTSWDVVAAGTGTIKLVYGTGTACATGTTDLTGAYSLVAQSGLAKGNGLGPVLVVPASNALCVTTSAAVGMQGSVAYTQF